MSEKVKEKPESFKVKNSSRPTYDIPIRMITGNTNPRNPLSSSLQSQGWDCMQGEKQVWKLAVSDDAGERATYVKLIQDFDPEIVSLAATILSQGLLEPVEVSEGGSKKFRLVFGARRCLAILFNWCLLGKPKEPMVQAFLKKGNETELLHRAIVENIRKPQSVIEEARSIQMAINNGEKKDEVCRQLGMSIGTINNRLALLDLPPKQQQQIHEGKLNVKKAREETAHANGTPIEKKPRMRSRKEVEEEAEEYNVGTKERAVFDWLLGKTEKIK